METIQLIKAFLVDTYTWETVSQSVADFRLLFLPLLFFALLVRKIGFVKSILFALLCLAVVIAFWSQVEIGGPAELIIILGGLLILSGLYFIYLVTIGAATSH